MSAVPSVRFAVMPPDGREPIAALVGIAAEEQVQNAGQHKEGHDRRRTERDLAESPPI